MALILTISLGFSVMGMLSLLILKRYELDTGKVVFAEARPRVGYYLERAVRLFVSVLPSLIYHALLRAKNAFLFFIHAAVARAALAIEQLLERILHTVREKTSPPRAPGEVSAFLREVADHKKQILHRRPRLRRTKKEEPSFQKEEK